MSGTLRILQLLLVAVTPAVGQTDGVAADTRTNASAAPQASANIDRLLASVPADAVMVIAVRDLAALSTKLERLSEGRGLLPLDLLTAAKSYLGIASGIDDHGSAALLVIGAEEPGAVAKSLPMLLPTSDAAAMLTHLSPRPAGDGFTEVTMRGRTSYASRKGAFTVFAAERATVESVLSAKASLVDRLTVHQRERFRENDFSILLRTEALELPPLRGIAPIRFLRSLGLGGGWLDAYKVVQLSLRIEPTGVALELYAARSSPRPVVAMRTASGSLLRGLPGERFALAGGLIAGAGTTNVETLGRLAVAVGGELGVVDLSRMDEVQRAVAKITGRCGDISFSLSELPGGSGGRVGLAAVLQTQDDPAALPDGIARLVDLLRTEVFIDPRANRALARLEYRRRVESATGVDVDHIVLDSTGFDSITQEAIGKVMGDEGVLLRLGIVDRKYVVATLGGGLTRFQEVVAAVRADRAPLGVDPLIARAAARLPSRRFLEGYLSPERVINLKNEVGKAFDPFFAGAPAETQESLVAWSVQSVSAEAVQLDLFLPLDVINMLWDVAIENRSAQRDPYPSPGGP